MKAFKSGTAVAFGILVAATSIAHAEPDVDGIWMRGDGNAKVRIAPCGNNLCATNLWIKDTSGGEAVGDRLVMDVKPSGDMLSGTAFDAKRNMNYKIDISVSGASLSTKGCVIGGLVCKTVSWSKSSE
ncbi:DUF2147 domain-containing protein [Corticibacterium sp. UT-5YL-CI-8]|nr:DUF2147 domain-containing protein [Tianweitania sp. UT-5YL-CI-8]